MELVWKCEEKIQREEKRKGREEEEKGGRKKKREKRREGKKGGREGEKRERGKGKRREREKVRSQEGGKNPRLRNLLWDTAPAQLLPAAIGGARGAVTVRFLDLGT